VDADWLPSRPEHVPALVAESNGEIAWCDGSRLQAPEDLDPDVAAALVFLRVAKDAADAVKDIRPQSVEIIGAGLIAQQVRLLVGTDSDTSEERPRAIIDTTGDPSVIAGATRRVADLGTIVLAGESLGRQFELNLYPDVHVRGLTLVGVAPPLHSGSFGALDGDRPLESWRDLLVRVHLGSFVPFGAAWYRVEA
jgi:threonine dehydrogenase-like Zn-dependent dehydrogenase